MKKNLLKALLPLLLVGRAEIAAMPEKKLETFNRASPLPAEEQPPQISKEDKGLTHKNWAVAYYKDQEQEKSFKVFLEALKEIPATETVNILAEEKIIYAQALKIYLEDAGYDSGKTAAKLISQFEPLFEKNPNFYHLSYLLAMSKANLGLYDQFFELFYHAYLHDPHHFLAYKAKAALYVKLFERAKTEEERQAARLQILSHARKAVDIEPYDTSLYRMIIGFTQKDAKPQALSTYLNRIIEQNVVLSRIDIPYYVEIALAFHQYDLAQRLLDKAKQWYAFSRVINLAQKLLDEKRGHSQK
ncbi:Uncharacterized protein NEOC65_000063 [Neochlamydia sp. AcF65]|uniref:hypothetical protein n=1 Tax=Neochlamydia sp. AcF65 TaxID=2795735 RepID=UPI001BC8D9FE|nr:hypothetical protein [Neochlamydia sp. AcF65]MBS4165017.1 Uncharacterized protein [Neochlamydia sp. AcF65]